MGLPLITFDGRRDEQKITGRPQVSKLYDFYFKNNL
jgi:hypothetical protein